MVKCGHTANINGVCIDTSLHLEDSQQNIFKFIGGISEKVIPNLSIDKEIALWGNAMVLSGVTYHY